MTAKSDSAPDRNHIEHSMALQRTVSWALASSAEHGAPASAPVHLAALVKSCARELRTALKCGQVLVVNDAIQEGEAAFVDRGSFNSWLALTPVERLCGREPTDRTRQCDVGAVTPLEAVQIALGEPLGKDALRAYYARSAHERGRLADHESGVGPLQPAALERTKARIANDQARDAVYAAEAAKLRTDIACGRRRTFMRGADGAMRPFDPCACTSDICLDVTSGRFMPNPELTMDSEAWIVARRACDAIGHVVVAVAEIKPRRRVGTAAAERRAEARLTEIVEAWVSTGAMSDAPIKAHWVSGEGAEIAGTPTAAKRVWNTIVNADPRFAKLRGPGRRPRERP